MSLSYKGIASLLQETEASEEEDSSSDSSEEVQTRVVHHYPPARNFLPSKGRLGVKAILPLDHLLIAWIQPWLVF